MRTLSQHIIETDISHLSTAWSGDPTFALVPDRSGTDHASIGSWLETLPARFRVGHYALLTSGSTGAPKLIIGRRERSEALVKALHRLQGLEDVVETLVSLPLTYSYAFVNQWLWSRVFGRRLVASRGLAEPDHLHAELSSLSGGMLCLVGAQVPLMLQHYASERFPGVIRLNFAGGRFPQEHVPALQQIFPSARIFNNYGCAEALPRLTIRAARDADDARVLGFPIDGVELMTDSESKLLFRSPYGAVALVEEGIFREVAPGEWLATGDLAESLPDGRWRLTGRASEVFKRYGEKISFAAITATVESTWHGGNACYRETDPAGEEGYVLVLSPAADETAVRAILHEFRAQHPRPRWPLRIEAVGAIPLLPNGKIDTMALVGLPDKTVLWRQRL